MAKEPDLHIPTYDGKRFTWKDGTGSIEASELIASGPPHARIWNDSCDVGFYVKGRESTKLLVLSHIERAVSAHDGEIFENGEIVRWEYEAYPFSSDHGSAGSGVKVVVYND